MSGQPRRKVRPDAPLKQLPEERQHWLAEQLESKSYAEVQKLLAADGIQTGRTALANFRQWYISERFLDSCWEASQQMVQELQQPDYGFTLQQATDRADANFLLLAHSRGVQKEYVPLRRIVATERKTQVASRSVAITEAKAAQADAAKATLLDGSLTTEQRQAKMREVFGITS